MSAPSPSSVSSASPVPPPTPLTPNSAHSVSFAVPPSADQFAFDALNLDTGANAQPTGNTANQSTNGGPARRKPSRRANTAERRATHNAVERQRRETLNGRFLDLAALLPNLASVRRPSKSAIVNSSIALIHTQRRARSTAARELRLLKLEADALRAEVNEWRERAGMGMARIEEPPRSREFDELVNGGLEEAEENLLEEERRALEIVKEGLRMDSMDNGLMMNPGQNPFAYNMNGGAGMYAGLDDDEDDSSDGLARTRPGSQGSMGSIPSLPINVPRQNAPASNPMIFDPSAALLQSHTTHQAGINAFASYDMLPAAKQQAQWFPQSYGQAQFTPPSASFLGGFGLRADDADDSSNSSVSDFGAAAYGAHPGMGARSRSGLASIQTALKPQQQAGTPPASAPASATTYAEAANSAGDAFAAAYNAFPAPVRVPGGGNTYGAAMGLFM